MADQIDRNRLKEVHQSDLTESRLNVDFIEWLKSSGMTYLLVILVAICALLGYYRWQDYRANQRRDAWRAYNETSLPSSLLEVAEKYDGVDAIGVLARLDAADTLMNAVLMGKEVGPPPSPDPANPSVIKDTRNPLTEAQRTEYLQRAQSIYQSVVERDDATQEMTLSAVSALNGLGAVAEANGNTEQAKGYFDRAVARGKADLPALADQSALYAQSISQAATVQPFPSSAQLISSGRLNLTPVPVEAWVNDLLKLDEAGPGQ